MLSLHHNKETPFTVDKPNEKLLNFFRLVETNDKTRYDTVGLKTVIDNINF